jgi:CRP-like cAMP-binding protein
MKEGRMDEHGLFFIIKGTIHSTKQKVARRKRSVEHHADSGIRGDSHNFHHSAELGKDQFFGESELSEEVIVHDSLQRSARSHTITCVTDVQVRLVNMLRALVTVFIFWQLFSLSAGALRTVIRNAKLKLQEQADGKQL